MKKILDLGSGRGWINWKANLKDLIQKDIFVDCVDRCYRRFPDSYKVLEETNGRIRLIGEENIINYLENYFDDPYDEVYATRVFEHFCYKEIPYLLYCTYSVMKVGGKITIIVPDFDHVANTVMRLSRYDTALQFHRVLVFAHTELFNEPSDPHRSIWNRTLAKYYMELEDFWEDINMENQKIENRSWYLRITAKKKDFDKKEESKE